MELSAVQKTLATRVLLIALGGCLFSSAVSCGKGRGVRAPELGTSAQRDLVLTLMSSPPEAHVYTVDSDGGPGELLGECPYVIAEFELGRERWRVFDEDQTPAPLEGQDSIASVETRRGSDGTEDSQLHGDNLILEYYIVKDGCDPTLFRYEISPEGLELLWRNPDQVIRVDLENCSL